MTSSDVQAVVERELATWRPPQVQPGTTIGVPWSAERYAPEVERLREALVTPYEQRFSLSETDDPKRQRIQGEAVYWVVAATADMYLWYDESAHEFGVAVRGSGDSLPLSIGLRGDIVGSFCAW